jgi:hypothetical protein
MLDAVDVLLEIAGPDYKPSNPAVPSWISLNLDIPLWTVACPADQIECGT